MTTDFRALFESTPTPFLVLTADFAVEAVNDAYLHATGQARAELVGRPLLESLPDGPQRTANEASLLHASLMRVLRSGNPESMPLERRAVRIANGSVEERCFHPVNTPLLDGAGAVTHIIHRLDDVTELVRAQLLEEQMRRDSAARSNANNVADRRRADVRPDAMIRLTGAWRDLEAPEEITYTASTVLGETLGVSRVGYGTIDHDAETLTVDRDWNGPGVESLAGTLNMRDYGSFIDDLKLGHVIAIGNVDDDPRTIGTAAALRGRGAAAFVNVPILEQGRLVAMAFVNNATPRDWLPEDIALIKELAERTRTASERLRNAQSMQHSEAKFRNFADAMPQMVWSTLPDGAHDYFNQRWYDFTGMPEGSTHGHGWSDIFHPDDQQRAVARWRHSLNSGEEYEIQYRLRDKEGAYRWVLGRALPLFDASGELIRWMGTCTDIHEQKMAEDELRRTSERKDEFLAMLAHELRNPLAPISSAAQLLKLPGVDEARLRLASDIIGRQVRHMTELVDDLLDVSRVTRGLVKLETEHFDIQTVIEAAVEQAGPMIEARHHGFEVHVPHAPVMIVGDKTRLIQAIANLLNNAAKYTPRNGKIALRARVDGAMLVLSVSDNGNGIDPALKPYVFDLFIQGKRTPDRAHGGLGLGLTLVKRIAALHGGEVGVVSAGVGEGSTFTLSIPLADTSPVN